MEIPGHSGLENYNGENLQSKYNISRYL
jgi:hypothetical protein